jgi:hypothetical protein
MPRVVGCPRLATALHKTDPPVSIRRGIRAGPFVDHVLIVFRDCRDPVSGSVLVLDLDADVYVELDQHWIRQSSRRLGGLELERAKDRTEGALGYRVRVVGR